MAKRWACIGGMDTAGILVREGQSLSSSAMDSRLSTGSVVGEQERIGNRLHFRLVSGEGPEEGWISVRLKEKVLVQPLAESASEKLIEKDCEVAVDVVVYGRMVTEVKVLASITVCRWKELLEQGELLGEKVLYAKRLRVSSKRSKGQALPDGMLLPRRPDIMLVSGNASVLQTLLLVLEKRYGESVEPPLDFITSSDLEVAPLPLMMRGRDPHIEFFCNGLQGSRDYMEDRTLGVLSLPGFPDAGLFGIFDGHGGFEVSDFVAWKLPGLLARELTKFNDPADALRESFSELDQEIRSVVSKSNLCGTTAAVCLVMRTSHHRLKLFCANCGDSRIVLCRNGAAISLSEDQKPGDKDEERRINSAGGRVDFHGRINGGLNLSRALGDFAYKSNTSIPADQQQVISVPVIKEVCVEPSDDQYVVIGSDGVFDGLSQDDTRAELIDLLNAQLNAGMTLENTVNRTLDATQHSGDNVAMCLFRFHWAES